MTARRGVGRPRLSVALPISEKEHERLFVACQRFQEACVSVASLFPPYIHGISSLARYLDIDRSTAQRFISATRPIDSLPQWFAGLPGADGVWIVAEALRDRRFRHDLIETLNDASTHLDREIHHMAGSRRRMLERLSPGGVPGDLKISREAAVRDAHRAATQLCGISAALHADFYWLTPEQGGARVTHCRTDVGISTGHESASYPVAWTRSLGDRDVSTVLQSDEPTLLEAWSSTPLPASSNALDSGPMLSIPGDRTMNVFWAHSRYVPSGSHIQWAYRPLIPTAGFHGVVFVHPEVKLGSPPVNHVHATEVQADNLHGVGHVSVQVPWVHEGPSDPSEVEVLGLGQVSDLVNAMNRSLNLAGEVGSTFQYQCPYPLWGLTYLLSSIIH